MRGEDDLAGAARSAAPEEKAADLATHSIPRLEGRASRGHRQVSVRRLRLGARLDLRARRAASGVEAFVQFAGFPRSGHSLVGALIDAHPEAAIAHELDAMGLFAKGVPPALLPVMAIGAAARFRADGQWWNGLSYAVDGAPPRGRVRVAGDKKGDWASRWCARDPGLWPAMRGSTDLRLPMILVTRNPFDNVATMTLRLGKTYDHLRIAHRGPAFAERLAAAQEEGEVPAEASDRMIEDYAALCAATEVIRRATPEADWHEVPYEELVGAPAPTLSALARFLALRDDEAWRTACATKVGAGGRSRHRVRWSRAQRASIAALTRAYPFLARYPGELD